MSRPLHRPIFPKSTLLGCLCLAVVAFPASATAQVTPADYERAAGLREKYEALALNVPGPATWIEKSHRFWYRRSVKGGNEFVLVDADTGQKRPPFDHEKLAATLATMTGRKVTAVTLPFNAFTFKDNERAIEARFDGATWTCTLADYACTKAPTVGAFEQRQPPPACTPPAPDAKPRVSPDGKWEAFVTNFNVAVREAGAKTVTALSTDGSEANCYELDTIAWAPDSKKLAAYRVKPGYRRLVHYVESSPEDQLQPKHSTRFYAKPGDVLDLEQPVIFAIESKQALAIDHALFPNPFDSLEARVAQGQFRGHLRIQPARPPGLQDHRGDCRHRRRAGRHLGRAEDLLHLLGQEVPARRGRRPRSRLDVGARRLEPPLSLRRRDRRGEEPDHQGGMGGPRRLARRRGEAADLVQRERDVPGQDPYFVYYYRINFDGTGLTRLTEAEANHAASFSEDGAFFVNVYSRVDQGPVSELRRASDGSLVTELERVDLAALQKAGWRPPEVFTAKGRDGQTDIWGVIYRPTTFDPRKKYPVIENIYAGPHSSFVPKSFSAFSAMQAHAELGFIVVQIDGMGTSNRSKAFHDVAWKNIKDAGFPDRILWHKAVAARYPSYDISRVGIYGTSAGGQNSLGALLFHPEFYKVAASAVGCHDNRMDKIWWNEQWMGWPIGPEYAASSNVDNAYRLQGNVLLVVGEMDTNVDPSSTMQVVNALIKANKTFDLLVIPGAGHGPGGAYGERKRYDFFVQHLLGQAPPAWNEIKAKTETPAPR